MTSFRILPVVALLGTILSGCYVVPMTRPDGTVAYQSYPLPPAGSPVAAPVGPMPTVLHAKLYPANEIASQTGVVTGTVTNLMTGKGQFQLSYLGDLLTGEATRVSNSDRRGVASAYGPHGVYMSCEYQMNTPYQGAGTCTFSNGAAYTVHLSSS
ncbi:MAG: hypothetical protein OEU93_14700 [Rubrivivax sp.]|nr:hypothetical protein [Rubrivivax sp.]